LHTNRDGTKLFVSCHNINNHTLLFVLDKTARTITANVARVRHVRPLINDLAEREGLRLKMRLKEHPDPSGAERNNLLYWKFNTEVDDSDLVSRAKLSLTGLHSDDADECDDCYCDNCCGTCGCCCDCED
jgi:hypothetical protein